MQKNHICEANIVKTPVLIDTCERFVRDNVLSDRPRNARESPANAQHLKRHKELTTPNARFIRVNRDLPAMNIFLLRIELLRQTDHARLAELTMAVA